MLREERRRHILEVAKKVFAEKGYHATGVADIIEACGVARGTFYLYFESKRNLFATLIEDFLALLNSKVKRIDETQGIEGILRQLRENVYGVFSLFAQEPVMSLILFNEAVGLDKGFDEILARFYDAVVDLIEHSLKLGQEMGIVRNLDTRVIAACILGSVREVIPRIMKGGFDLDKVVDEVIDYNIRALFVPSLIPR